jgi:hypothetical protein
MNGKKSILKKEQKNQTRVRMLNLWSGHETEIAPHRRNLIKKKQRLTLKKTKLWKANLKKKNWKMKLKEKQL